MEKNEGNEKCCGIRKFFKGLAEKLDKKMKEKAESSNCCCGPKDKKDNSCCS